MSTHLKILRPDDWHLHLRDGAQLRAVVGFTAERFGRAIVMPNLKPPVVTAADAAAYRRRVIEALPAGSAFQPLMTLYLTERTRPQDIAEAKASGIIYGVKLYPAGATTNADAGVSAIERSYPVLEKMAEVGLPFLVHGESIEPDVDVFDREARFIETTLAPVVERFPTLKVVFEHVTTREAVRFVLGARADVGATITPQHLLLNRNALFKGGLRPHYYCLPVLKREHDREALVEAATSGNPRFFLGTDSAPHAQHTKEAACGCAGIFSSHAGIELYAEAFETAGRLDRLEAFASHFGADFYGLARNTDQITLVKEAWTPPPTFVYADHTLVPFRAGELVHWRLQTDAVKA